MTTILFDSDSLIKLTKAGAKEDLVNNFNAFITLEVKEECIDEGQGKPDAVIISQNIENNKLAVVKNEWKRNEISGLKLGKGEISVYAASCQIKHDIISSDDQKFLRLLNQLGKKAVTSSSLIVLLYKKRKISKERALRLLDGLKEHVNEIEYDLCKHALEEK
ncbi:hypothetical protein COV18_00770 [Candidatus Woesearchaeota archaeon CG10_big_fil_rev_8_21_14_0_10_37_12]|nr:MAG: hypothetical protein COV18_00770 [Candidatus Woesearchaeota archaeon CG10_big_fil_rev_8_21_14_0_10_37_12]